MISLLNLESYSGMILKFIVLIFIIKVSLPLVKAADF